LPDTIKYCQGDTGKVIAIVSHFGSKTTVNWETPMGSIKNTRKVHPYKAGKYYVKVSSAQFARPLIDSAYVRVYQPPVLRLKDTVICKGQLINLDAKNQGMNYLWSNGEFRQRTKISTPGRYWVKIVNGACSLSDTVVIKSAEKSGISIKGESVFCFNDENKILSVKASPGTKIEWSTGAKTTSIAVTREGTYWVKTENMGCGTQTDTLKVKMKACDCEVLIPNSFTPNEDYRNDYFTVISQCEYSNFVLTINDRWGYTVFTSNNVNAKWDGRFKGNLCPEDIYSYQLETTEKLSGKKQVRSGHVSLFR
jgi:gliding motility-associated-like protein